MSKFSWSLVDVSLKIITVEKVGRAHPLASASADATNIENRYVCAFQLNFARYSFLTRPETRVGNPLERAVTKGGPRVSWFVRVVNTSWCFCKGIFRRWMKFPSRHFQIMTKILERLFTCKALIGIQSPSIASKPSIPSRPLAAPLLKLHGFQVSEFHHIITQITLYDTFFFTLYSNLL